MLPILTGLVVFFFSLVLHVVVWRVFRPVSYFKALPAVFLIPAAVAGAVAVYASLHAPLFGMDPVDWAAALMLHLALAGAYIMSYPALQANSPSLVIILRIEASMPEGLTEEELSGIFPAGGLVGERIDDLAVSGFITVSGRRCALTPRGRALLTPFIILRRLLGLPAGSG